MREMVKDMFDQVAECSHDVELTWHFHYCVLPQMHWLPPHVGHTVPFCDALQALTLLQSGKTTGKVLLEVK